MLCEHSRRLQIYDAVPDPLLWRVSKENAEAGLQKSNPDEARTKLAPHSSRQTTWLGGVTPQATRGVLAHCL